MACLVCAMQRVQKWGRQNGKQRYHCTECNHNFIVVNEGVKKANRFVWFYKWVMERQVYQHLVRDSGMSQSSLQRLFKTYLKSPPQNTVQSKAHVHLLIDEPTLKTDCVLYYITITTSSMCSFSVKPTRRNSKK